MRYFLYCRKSTESEDRQVLSIASQESELRRAFESQSGMQIVDVLRESYSAKAPGRPIFNEMMERITRGEADGILAWHPDRLARNSVDGGRIIYLLDTQQLKDLKFATFSFENSPQGKLMLSVLLGFSKYYVDSLSENVKRGIRAKVERGWRCGRAPIGYRNDIATRMIVPDRERFPMLKRLFAYALSGAYSVPGLLKILNDDWGFRTPRCKHSGGRPLGLSTLYKVLQNPFYAGYFLWHGNLLRGAHVPMITMGEYESLQQLLGRPGTKKPQRYDFPFTGLIRCGACGLMVTAEHKTNKYGSRYIYYHCTKRNVGEKCRQQSVEARVLESQIVSFLRSLRIDDGLHRWLIQQASALQADPGVKEETRKSLNAALADTERQRNALTDLRIRELVSDDDFLQRRHMLQRTEYDLQEKLNQLEDEPEDWFEQSEFLFSFSNRAAEWFQRGNNETKRLIVETVGSNSTLIDRKLSIEAAKPFLVAEDQGQFLQRCGFVDNVRTFFANKDKITRQRVECLRRVMDRMMDREDEGRMIVLPSHHRHEAA